MNIIVIAFVGMLSGPNGSVPVHDVVVTQADTLEECRSKDLPKFQAAALNIPVNLLGKAHVTMWGASCAAITVAKIGSA